MISIKMKFLIFCAEKSPIKKGNIQTNVYEIFSVPMTEKVR